MSTAPSDPAEFYRRMFDRRSREELSAVARVKRFRERLIADPAFRAALAEHADAPDTVTRRCGLPVEASAMRPLWDPALARGAHFADWPLVAAWKAWHDDLETHRGMLAGHAETRGRNPLFDQWHRRQTERCGRELGSVAPRITHPIAAFELSKGCSVGCWFCAVAADSFRGHVAYEGETVPLWRGMLQAMADLFGPAAQTMFCYWATDPLDNPHYADFIRDFRSITGWLPMTTTAAPLKNLPLTREVLRLSEERRCVPNRFSILTLPILERVHAEFTPEELLGVELVLHMKGSLVPKTVAGRALERKRRLREDGRSDKLAELELEHGTIACVSGFLVSLPDRTVKMVSPWHVSERYPLGYRTFAEASFASPETFHAAIEEMLERHLPDELAGAERIVFREDLVYMPLDDGFRLGNAAVAHTVSGRPFMRRLGEMIAAGGRTAGDIVGELVASGEDVFAVGAALQDLFDMSLAEGVAAPAIRPDHGCRAPVMDRDLRGA